MKIALVYDRINKWGGAERILMLLHEMFPRAPVYTSVYDPVAAPWAKDLKIHTSFLESIPYARRHHEFFALLMPLAFESFDFDSYDVVISLTSEAAKGIVTKPGTRHICICLTPTRYLWSEYRSYFPSQLERFIFAPIIFYLRMWDKVAAGRPDKIISISKTVQERVKKYYKRDSEIAYPPLFLKGQKDKTKDEGYFLVVSRLSRFTPHKRVEIAIKAANKLKLPLKVVGAGDISYFKEMAGRTVEIVGSTTDKELEQYYKNCTALIFPGIEDFGLVMVEAQAYGKPVIAYRGGGATEIIREGKTGVFFDRPNVNSLVNTLKSFDKRVYNGNRCKENARRFSVQNFKRMIEKSLQGGSVNP
ncbi:MAG: glycosyltransferase [Candidatus Levyibacteriota bacterium]